jgi:hypothetical protein
MNTQVVSVQRKLIHVRHSVFAGTLGTPKSEASKASLPMPLNLAVRFTSKRFIELSNFLSKDM